MSNLLEQAIIDAAALRETALKSAEAALIEKYKEEFEQSLKKLNEQDELSTEAPPPEQENPMPEMAADQVPQQTEESGGEAFEDIPSSFLDGDEDELVTIDFDKIEKQLQDILSPTMLATPDESGLENETSPEQSEAEPQAVPALEQPQELTEDLELFEENSEELEEEFDLEVEEAYDRDNKEGLNIDALTEKDDDVIHLTISDEEEQEELEEMDAGQNYLEQIARKKQEIANLEAQRAKDLAQRAKQEPATDTTEITEEEIQELDEELEIDIDVEGLLAGYMGATSKRKTELRNLELAAARDSKAEEDRKKDQEKIGDLEGKLKESQEKNKKYSQLVEELKENLNILREHTEKLSVSNAKLLYTNKVFGNNSLNERQKEQIVESISKSQTVLEAKTIYGTLQSAVQSVKETKHKESLSEALNRGSPTFIGRQKQTSVDGVMSERMKILAGIKNK